MPNFHVDVDGTISDYFHVEAETHDEAEQKAVELFRKKHGMVDSLDCQSCNIDRFTKSEG